MDIVETHIKTVVGRYKTGSSRGEIVEWTVINEILGNGPDLSTNFFTDNLEDDPLNLTYKWAEDAFGWAHEADPNAALILNDFYFEYGEPKTDQLYNLVSGWIAKGVPIHGIGFQMHLWGNDFVGDQLNIRMSELATTIRRFQSLGLDVYVTELDIDMRFVQGANRLDFQATIYRRLEVTSDLADPTLFDDNYNKKPAYFQVLLELKERISLRQSHQATSSTSSPSNKNSLLRV